MSRQPDHAHVVGEIFAAELRSDADVPAQLEDLRFHVQIAKRASVLVAAGGERVQIVGAGQLHRLHGEFG